MAPQPGILQEQQEASGTTQTMAAPTSTAAEKVGIQPKRKILKELGF